jgi:hypothetical protein
VKETGIEEKLYQFIKEFGDDLNTLELLLFFSRHPNARFNRTAVLHAITSKRFDTGLALKRLIDKKIIVTYFDSEVTLYALTKDEPYHTLASELVSIDQSRWQKILGYILDANGIQ